MAGQLPEPYRYVTNTGSMRVHRVMVCAAEVDPNDWMTVCQWRFRAGPQPWVWGRHWVGIRVCAQCSGDDEEEEGSNSDSEYQESAVSQ